MGLKTRRGRDCLFLPLFNKEFSLIPARYQESCEIGFQREESGSLLNYTTFLSAFLHPSAVKHREAGDSKCQYPQLESRLGEEYSTGVQEGRSRKRSRSRSKR